jgi:hypothetical protein
MGRDSLGKHVLKVNWGKVMEAKFALGCPVDEEHVKVGEEV